jgi:metallophosphoesterase superfamily enzyme
LFTAGEISGHYHPKASLDVRGRRLSGRCFVVDEYRLVLPAFGAYAGGLDVFEPALRALFPGDFAVHLLARDRITSLPHARLAGGW